MVEKPKEFRLLSIAFVLAGVILGVVGSVWLLPSLGIRPKDRSLKKFDLILNKVVEEYVEDVDVDKLTEAAARGLLKDLDPHSIYIPAQKKNIIDDNMRGNYAGLGLTIIVVRDTLLVAEVHSELSEDNNGIAIGDRILAADSLNLQVGATGGIKFDRNRRGRKGRCAAEKQ